MAAVRRGAAVAVTWQRDGSGSPRRAEGEALGRRHPRLEFGEPILDEDELREGRGDIGRRSRWRDHQDALAEYPYGFRCS